MTMQTLSTAAAQASPEVPINENFQTLEWASTFGRRHPVTTALTWGYYGGTWGGLTVADGTVTLTNSASNYIVALRSTGAVSVATTTTAWNDTGTYARIYKLTVAGSVVTVVEDHRAGQHGVFGDSAVGRTAIWVPARDMSPSATGGCSTLTTIASAASQPDIQTLDFDSATQEFAQFSVRMPKRWNLGTVTFLPVWSHAATTVNFGVVWELQGVAVSNDDPIAVAYGTAVGSTDTGGTTNDLYLGPESAAITIAGTPAVEDVVFFRVARAPANGSDTLGIDARLHGVTVYVTVAAPNDV